MTDAETFIQHINDHYDELKWKFYKFCKEKHYDFDLDIFSDTILKCYETITKNGKLADTTNQGIENYFFRAFKNNIMNEKRYSRCKNRDYNITSDDIGELYENWYNHNNTSARDKIAADLFKDFSVLYIMTKVEEQFDAEHFYLFRIKTLVPNMTYSRLQQTTKIPQSRKKTITVMRWVKDNITKEEIRKVFYTIYGDLID